MTVLRTLCFALFFVFPVSLLAQEITTSASAAYLYDLSNKTDLFAHEADTRMPTSSMSKMMTIYLVFDALKSGKLTLNDEMTVSEKAWGMPGSRSFANVGSKVKVEDLIRGVIIQSGNDAAVVLAEGLAGTEYDFAEKLNAKAKELGMNNSHFVNASGLPEPEHYSTPRDLALLARHLIEDFPEYYHYFSEKEFEYNGIKQGNRNPLLYRDLGADGLKTGHADDAGYGVTASTIRNGRRLILVVNGLPDMQARADEAARLIEIGYHDFEVVSPYKAGEIISEVPVVYGQVKKVQVALAEEAHVVLASAQARAVTFTSKFKDNLEAPIAKNAEIGTLTASLGDKVLGTFPLLAYDNVPRLDFFPLLWAKLKFLVTGKHGE